MIYNSARKSLTQNITRSIGKKPSFEGEEEQEKKRESTRGWITIQNGSVKFFLAKPSNQSEKKEGPRKEKKTKQKKELFSYVQGTTQVSQRITILKVGYR